MDWALLIRMDAEERRWSKKYFGEKYPEIKVTSRARSAQVVVRLGVQATIREGGVVSQNDLHPGPTATWALFPHHLPLP